MVTNLELPKFDTRNLIIPELATIETIDSGAVYTLALKTHIGMSVDVWRYMAGWCDKIQGITIPIRYNYNKRQWLT